MNYEERDPYGMYKASASSGKGSDLGDGSGPDLMGADTLVGNNVCNFAGESLGDVKEIMLDMRSGTVGYAVLSFGGFMGVGEKLFAVPWKLLKLDTKHKRFTLDVNKDQLENAPGFDKDHWPDMADAVWQQKIHAHYVSPGRIDETLDKPG